MNEKKYMDYKLAYDMYREVDYLLGYGIEKVEERFEEVGDRANGYTIFYGSEYNTWVYVVDKNFDTCKESMWYANGEVDIISYSECNDTLFINDIEMLGNRLDNLENWSEEHNYSNEDYKNEEHSIKMVMNELSTIRGYGDIMVYLALQIRAILDLEGKWFCIDLYCDLLDELSRDFITHDNYNMSLLDSINDYVENKKQYIKDRLIEKNIFDK